MKCQMHIDCPNPVVAKVGLPRSKAAWVCKQGFDEWRQRAEKVREEDATKRRSRES